MERRIEPAAQFVASGFKGLTQQRLSRRQKAWRWIMSHKKFSVIPAAAIAGGIVLFRTSGKPGSIGRID
jgi:hypothetical protein